MSESEWRTKFLNACDEIDRRKAAKAKDAEDLVALRAEVERLRDQGGDCDCDFGDEHPERHDLECHVAVRSERDSLRDEVERLKASEAALGSHAVLAEALTKRHRLRAERAERQRDEAERFRERETEHMARSRRLAAAERDAAYAEVKWLRAEIAKAHEVAEGYAANHTATGHDAGVFRSGAECVAYALENWAERVLAGGEA